MAEERITLVNPDNGNTQYPETLDQFVKTEDGGNLKDKVNSHQTSKSNPHNVTKAQVGLGNVDNTSDLDKPISSATQTALNLKAEKASSVSVGSKQTFTAAQKETGRKNIGISWKILQTVDFIDFSELLGRPIDLSLCDIYGDSLRSGMTTANSYVVSGPGTYMIPLVYGCGIKNGETNYASFTRVAGDYTTDFVNHLGNTIASPWIEGNTGCEASETVKVWETEAGMISELEFYTAGGKGKYLKFKVTTETAGNALIGIKDSAGNIIWSWHIWNSAGLTLKAENFVNFSGVDYELLNVPLGWNGSTACFYQWGRKDALPPTNVTGYSAKTGTTIAESIKNPSVFFINRDEVSYKWNDLTYDYNLWDATNTTTGVSDKETTKSIYDPCPVGWKVPGGRAFTGFTGTGSNTSDSSQFKVIGSWSAGWTFKRNSQDTVGSKFQALGCRYRASGALANVSSNGYYWSSSSNSSSNAFYLYFNSGSVYPLIGSYRAYGFSLRPLRE